MTTIPKLPVWKTTRACYALVFANLGAFVRISWLWILVMIPVYAAIHWFNWTITQSDQAWPDDWRRTAVSVFILLIPELIFLSSIAVAWHQFILRDAAPRTNNYLNVNRTVVAYAALVLVVFFIPLAVIIFPVAAAAAYLLASTPDIDAQVVDVPGLNISVTMLNLAVLFTFAGAIAVASIALRCCLKFPALALKRPTTLIESWRLTSGNTFRLALTSFLCSLPTWIFVAAWIILTWDWPIEQPLATYIRHETLFAFGYAIPTIFGVTLFSLAYRHFVDQAPPAAS
jgi:hypothetical protein